MRRTVAVMVLVAALAGCGGGSDEVLPLGVAFCNDLENGSTPFQILNDSVKDGTYTPRSAAEMANQWARESCPEQLKANEGLRSYLEGWGIDPDQR